MARANEGDSLVRNLSGLKVHVLLGSKDYPESLYVSDPAQLIEEVYAMR